MNGSSPFLFLCLISSSPSPRPTQASAAAEPHAGLLPAGQPAQHGVSVHTHLRDLRAGERRGRLPLHGLRLAGDLRLLGRERGAGRERAGHLQVLGDWGGEGRGGALEGKREVCGIRTEQKPPNSMILSTLLHCRPT